MICDECGKNIATIKLMTFAGGEKIERHLCASCMSKMRSQLGSINLNLSGLAGILGGLLQSAVAHKGQSAGSDAPQEVEEHLKGLTCPGCGMTYEAFRQTGFLGCAQCYQAFREPLGEMIKHVQGTNAQHCGRVPGGQSSEVSIRLNIDKLKQQLGRAIAEEEYEDAARLRDQIRALKAQLSEIEAEEGGAEHVH